MKNLQYLIKLPNGKKELIKIVEKDNFNIDNELKQQFKNITGVDFDLGNEKLRELGFGLTYEGFYNET